MSTASNLVSGDTNGKCDVFVHDRQTYVTERVSVSSTGEQGNDDAWDFSISDDGLYVVFGSAASNLVNGDTNGELDIFVHDRQTDMTERVSVSSTGEQTNGWSRLPAISANGRYLAFWSNASNLVSGDTNNLCDTNADGNENDNCPDVFVHDRQTGATEMVSLSSTGIQGAIRSYSPSISADGRFVAFQSFADNLVSGDSNGEPDIFVRDCCPGGTCTTDIVSSEAVRKHHTAV